MKQRFLLKMVLVAAGLFMGLNGAWAQVQTVYNFEDGNALFSQDSRITAAVVSGTQTIYNDSFELDGKAVRFTGASNAQNGYCFAHFDFSSLCDQAAKVKVEFDAVLGNGARSIISIGDALVRGNTGNSTKTTYSNKGAIFRVGTDKNNSFVNGSNVGNSGVVSQKWIKVTVEVDEIEKTYNYSIVNKLTEETLFSDESVSFYSSDATNCTQIDMFGYINSSQMGLIDNLIITVTKDERQQANYTVKFVDEIGTEIKESATRQGAVGDGITLLPADKEPFFNESGTKKYFYKSDDTESKTISKDGTTVVTVTYREAESWNYTVNFVAGETILGQKTGSVFEGESASVPYSKYLASEGQLYTKDNTNKEYNYKFTPNQNNQVVEVSYSVVNGVNNVVFCTEGENVEGLTACNTVNTGVRSSNSSSAYASEDTKITTLPAGKYKIHAIIYDSHTNPNSNWTFMAGDVEACTFNCTIVNIQEFDSEEFTIGSQTDIIMKASGNEMMGLDAIYIVKTGEIETATITAAKYATFIPTMKVAVPEGVTAYYVTNINANGKARMEEVSVIPANKAVILYKDVNVNTQVIFEPTDAVEVNLSNILNYSDAETVADGTQYILADGEDGVGFYKAKSETIIPARKAYLVSPVGANFLSFCFDDETTGIEKVENAAVNANGTMFNLAGQRVAQPTKGLYIVNGKKVVVK